MNSNVDPKSQPSLTNDIIGFMIILNDSNRVPNHQYSLAHSAFILRLSINALLASLLAKNEAASNKLLRRVFKTIKPVCETEQCQIWFGDIIMVIRWIHENQELFGLRDVFLDHKDLVLLLNKPGTQK